MPPTPSTSPALNSVTSSISFSREQPGQLLRGDRLRERAVERRRVDELDAVADAALAEVPVGEERELERRDRALDRHVDEVDDEAAAVEALERRAQRRRAVRRVEGEDALVPARAGQALGLLGLQPRAGGDDEHVVGEDVAVVEHDLVPVEPDPATSFSWKAMPFRSCRRRGRTISSSAARPNGTKSRPGW